MPSAGQVVVYVTRLGEEGLELLVRREAAGSTILPHAAVWPGEHPCAAALRATEADFGLAALWSFRKLGEIPAATGGGCLHIFQTAADSAAEEQAWAHTAGRHWLPLRAAQQELAGVMGAGLKLLQTATAKQEKDEAT